MSGRINYGKAAVARCINEVREAGYVISEQGEQRPKPSSGITINTEYGTMCEVKTWQNGEMVRRRQIDTPQQRSRRSAFFFENRLRNELKSATALLDS